MSVETGGSTTTPNSPLVRKTSDTLLRGLTDTYKGGVDVFNKPLYTDPSAATRGAWTAGTNFGNSVVSANGFGPGQQAAMTGLGGLGSQYAGLGSAYEQDAPGYQALRSKLRDDTATGIYADFNNSGLFGSDANMESAGEGIASALAGLDYGNFQNNVNNQYRSLDSQRGIFGDQFGMGQQALTNEQNAVGLLGQVGSAQDANNLAKRMGEYDLFTRQHDADWEALARASSILGGTAGAAGSTTSNTVPWWAALLGGAATGASIFG